MRCPVCRAADNRTAQCRRCKADLSLLVGLERDRAAHLAAAQLHAGRGDGAACVARAQAAHGLRADADSWRWLATGMLLNRDFAGAWQAYGRYAMMDKLPSENEHGH